MIPNTLPQSLIDNPRLDQWIAFEPEGRIRVGTGKVEIGQGILTALLQIAADELDVAPERVRMISGDTRAAPNEGMTAGSLSVEVSGRSIRFVTAEVRRLFLEKAAARLTCETSDIEVRDGIFFKDGRATGLDYWTLAADVDLDRAATATAPVKRPRDYRVVGQSLPRVDLPAKVAASGQPFIQDLAPEGVVHARMLRQPWPGAELADLDETAVRRAAGEGVEIHREGSLVAILALSEAAAVKGLEAARRRSVWSGGRPLSAEQAGAAWLAARPAGSRTLEQGKAAAGVQPVRTLTAVYTKPYYAHGSIGTACALARLEAGTLTVWSHSQGIYVLRAGLARTLGLDPAAIHIVHQQSAGCYGHNGADDVAFDAALLAIRRPGTTVRVLWSREDELGAGPFQSAMHVRVEAGVDAKGRPLTWRLDVTSGTHSQRPGAGPGVNFLGRLAMPDPPPRQDVQDVPDAAGAGAVRNAFLLYDLPHQLVGHHLIQDTPIRTSAMRGLGAFANTFALESFMDELAAAAGEDPVRYRLALLSEPRARAVLEKVAAMCAWSSAPALPEGVGRGVAVGRYKGRAGYLAIVVEVEVAEEVRLRKVWTAVDAGLIVSPDGLRNQIEGGIIQAASWTLKEAVRFEDGRVASDTWDTYPILRFSEIPDIEIALIDRPEEPALGAGEVAQGPTGAAIANAVAAALGVRVRALPLSRETILAALEGTG